MEHGIPALMIAAIMILGGVLLTSAAHDSVENVNTSWRQMEAISEERIGTELSVVSTSLDPSGAQLTATIRNDGRTSVGGFEYMDVIVNYDGDDLQRHNRWIPYSDTVPPPANSWSVASIANDYKNPGIFDTGEELTVTISLSPASVATPDRWVTIATETGVSYSVYF